MDDILQDDSGAQTFPIDLGEIVQPRPLTDDAPFSAVRNRAATSAFIGSKSGDDMTQNYRQILAENAGGSDVTSQQIMDNAKLAIKSQTMGSIIKVMGDPSIPIDRKKGIMNWVQKYEPEVNPREIVAQHTLEQPSKGESVEGEKARISLADSMGKINKDVEMRQKLANEIYANLPTASIGSVGEVASSEVMPLGNNYYTMKLMKALNPDMGFMGQAKAFLMPGSAKQAILEKLNNMPADKRADYANQIADAIKSSNALFGKENDFVRFRQASEFLANASPMSDTAAITENLMTLLDATWIGAEAKAGVMAVKGTKAAAKAEEVIKAAEEVKKAPEEIAKQAPKQQPQESLAFKPSQPEVGTPEITKQINALEKEKADLLGDAGNIAEKGAISKAKNELAALEKNTQLPDVKELTRQYQKDGMKFKEAQAKASSDFNQAKLDYEAKTNRLKSFIESNTTASELSKRVDAIDRQLADLKSKEVMGVGKLNPIADAIKRMQLNSVVREEHPASLLATIEQTNPSIANDIINNIAAGTDEFAHAVSNVSRDQALSNALLPQIGTETGNVLNKVRAEFYDTVTNTGALRYTDNEIKQATAHVEHNFRNATELQINDAMTTIRVDGDHVVVDAHYKTPGGSFTSVADARTQAEYALRDLPIQPDDIKIMKRDGMDYVLATNADVQAGDYIVKVSSRVPMLDSYINEWSNLTVKRNWADRLSQTMSQDRGSLTRWMVNPASMFERPLAGAAIVSTDQSINLEKILLNPIKEFRSSVRSLSNSDKVTLHNYFKEVNFKGLDLDVVDLKARGFSNQMIDSAQKWRDIWDRHFYLENYDLVRTLRSQNFKVFDDGATKFFGKEIGKNQNIQRLLDPATGTVVSKSKAEMDMLYNSGGTYVQLRRPITINGVEVEHAIVINKGNSTMRAIRDTDQILNYRKGYYTVEYRRGSKFIDEIGKDATGKEVRQTVAVAGNTKDAEMFASNQAKQTGKRYEVREDVRGLAKDSDQHWDINSASGRIAQRVRGQSLTSAQGNNILALGSFVEDPMESAMRAAKSLSARTAMRPTIETAKQRFMAQYGDLVKNMENGINKFPSHISQIVDENRSISKRAADARSTYEYINYLQHGYINTADTIVQGGLQIIADILGKAGMGRAEAAFNAASGVSATHLSKSVTYRSYIAMALPVRQWLVQGWQGVRMVGYNPTGVGRMGDYMREWLLLPITRKETEFTKFVEESGILASVDKNSLVRGMGLSLADSSSRTKNALGMLWDFPQKIGFDVGETVNMLFHTAAVYDKYKNVKGVNIADKTLRDAAFSEIRALSGGLNRADELAYTQSSASALLQFLQMPHKMLLTATNRNLDFTTKANLFLMDTILFGAPVGIVGGVMNAAGGNGGDILPDNQEARDALTYGATTVFLNHLLNMFDEEGEGRTRVDFSGLAPYNLDGIAKMYKAYFTQGLMGAANNSPIGQMFAVENTLGATKDGRVAVAFKSLMRYMNVFEEYDPENPTEFKTVMSNLAKITSGWSAADKAFLMLETRKKVDRLGVKTDSNVTTGEIIGAFMGFETLSTKELYETSQEISTLTKNHEKEVMAKYHDILQYLKESLSAENPDVLGTQRTVSMLMRTFRDPEDLKMVHKQWEKDMAGKEFGLLKQIMFSVKLPDSYKTADAIRNSPLSDQEKQLMLQRLEDVKKARETIQKDK